MLAYRNLMQQETCSLCHDTTEQNTFIPATERTLSSVPASPQGHSCIRCHLGGSLWPGQPWSSWQLSEKPPLLSAHWSVLPWSPYLLPLLPVCLPGFPLSFPLLCPSLLLQQATKKRIKFTLKLTDL